MTKQALIELLEAYLNNADIKKIKHILLYSEEVKALLEIASNQLQTLIGGSENDGQWKISVNLIKSLVGVFNTDELPVMMVVNNEEIVPPTSHEDHKEEIPQDLLSPEVIAKNLEHRRQKAKEGQAFGKPIPQIKIEPKDIEKALNELKGVNQNYLKQHGFLTNVYRNAAKRTGTDISAINEGLMIKFE
ncbi:MAG: hypothetical protein AAF634_05005 [Bacteroidota bacterium]